MDCVQSLMVRTQSGRQRRVTYGQAFRKWMRRAEERRVAGRNAEAEVDYVRALALVDEE
jgi:hypothetical protein